MIFRLETYPVPDFSALNYLLAGLVFIISGLALAAFGFVLLAGSIIAGNLVKKKRNVAIKKQKTWIFIQSSFFIISGGIIGCISGLNIFPGPFRKRLDDFWITYPAAILVIALIFFLLKWKKFHSIQSEA